MVVISSDSFLTKTIARRSPKKGAQTLRRRNALHYCARNAGVLPYCARNADALPYCARSADALPLFRPQCGRPCLLPAPQPRSIGGFVCTPRFTPTLVQIIRPESPDAHLPRPSPPRCLNYHNKRDAANFTWIYCSEPDIAQEQSKAQL